MILFFVNDLYRSGVEEANPQLTITLGHVFQV